MHQAHNCDLQKEFNRAQTMHCVCLLFRAHAKQYSIILQLDSHYNKHMKREKQKFFERSNRTIFTESSVNKLLGGLEIQRNLNFTAITINKDGNEWGKSDLWANLIWPCQMHN